MRFCWLLQECLFVSEFVCMLPILVGLVLVMLVYVVLLSSQPGGGASGLDKGVMDS